MSIPSVHSSAATGLNAATVGPSGPALPPKESMRVTQGDQVVLSVLAKAKQDSDSGNTPALNEDIQNLMIAAAGQENSKGQASLLNAVKLGNIRSSADLARFNSDMQRNAMRPPLGDITLQVDDAIVTAAAQASGKAPMQGPIAQHESPPTGSVIASASQGSSNLQNMPQPQAQPPGGAGSQAV